MLSRWAFSRWAAQSCLGNTRPSSTWNQNPDRVPVLPSFGWPNQVVYRPTQTGLQGIDALISTTLHVSPPPFFFLLFLSLRFRSPRFSIQCLCSQEKIPSDLRAYKIQLTVGSKSQTAETGSKSQTPETEPDGVREINLKSILLHRTKK